MTETFSRSPNRVTVVIPAFKAEKTIARAIESVLRQEGCEARIVVVVDGELDRTKAVAKNYPADRVNVIVNPENKGVQFSRNRGLDEVDDEFVMFLDADDFVEGPLLASLCEEMRRENADLGLGPMQTLFENSGRRGPTTFLETARPEDLFVGWLAENRFVSPCSVLWRTQFVRQIGAWDPVMQRQEDGEIVMRAILMGARIAYSKVGHGVYVLHDSTTRLTRSNDNLASLLAVPDKLMRMQSKVVSPQVVNAACAASFYNAAQTCFVRGRPALGAEALRRSRNLGFRGHRGSAQQRILASALGLRLAAKVERIVRRATGKAS